MRERKNCSTIWPLDNPCHGDARDIIGSFYDTLLVEEMPKLQIMFVHVSLLSWNKCLYKGRLHCKKEKEKYKIRSDGHKSKKKIKRRSDGLYRLMTASISFDEKEGLQSCCAF